MSGIGAQFQPALDVVELARQMNSLRIEYERGPVRASTYNDRLDRVISGLASLTSLISANPHTALLIPDIVEITGLVGSAKAMVEKDMTNDFIETARRVTDQLLTISDRLTRAAQQTSDSITDAVRRRAR